MLEGDFESAMLTGGQGGRNLGDRVRFAESDLIRIVEELDGQFERGKRTATRIDGLAGERGDLLVEEIFRAAQGDIFDADIGGGCPFRGTNRETRRRWSRYALRFVIPCEKEKDDDNENGGSREECRENKPVPRPRFVGRWHGNCLCRSSEKNQTHRPTASR